MNDILNLVATTEGISIAQMQSKSREQEIVGARHKAMWLAKKFTNFSLKTIGRHLGRKDHSTVIHALQCVEWNMQNDHRYKARLERMAAQIEALEAERATEDPRIFAHETISRATISVARFG